MRGFLGYIATREVWAAFIGMVAALTVILLVIMGLSERLERRNRKAAGPLARRPSEEHPHDADRSVAHASSGANYPDERTTLTH